MRFIEIIYPLGASIIWSVNPAFIYKYARSASPYYFTAIRALLASIFIAILVFTIGSPHLGDINTPILLLMILSAILGPGLGDIAYTRAIQLVGGSLAITISYVYIFFAQLFAVLLFNERLSLMAIIGSIVAFTGIYIAISERNNTMLVTKRGIVCSISAAILWGLAASMISPIREYVDAYTTAFIRTLVVAIFALIMGFIHRDEFNIDKNTLIAASFTGIGGWGIGMVLFVYSIYTIGVSVTSTTTALAPVLSQFINKAITGESISSRVFAGAILVCFGIIFTVL
ncbi:MAG: DMT family transporter [Desulfurococcaceae archaeon]